MAYVDGLVLAVKRDARGEYKRRSEVWTPVFRDHGALEVVECWGDDVPDGETTSFPMAVKKTDDEVVVFGWIKWPDKATRDKGMPAAMQDPRLAESMDMATAPFDGKRMIFGGFEVLHEG